MNVCKTKPWRAVGPESDLGISQGMPEEMTDQQTREFSLSGWVGRSLTIGPPTHADLDAAELAGGGRFSSTSMRSTLRCTRPAFGAPGGGLPARGRHPRGPRAKSGELAAVPRTVSGAFKNALDWAAVAVPVP